MKKQKTFLLSNRRVQLVFVLVLAAAGLYLAARGGLFAVFGSSGSTDNEAPTIAFELVALDRVALRLEDDSGIRSVKYDILSPEDYVSPVHGPCQRARYDLFTSSSSSGHVFGITDANLGKYLCVKVVDDSPARNTAYGYYQLHTHQSAVEQAYYYHHRNSEFVSERDFKQDFKLEVAHYQPSSGHLDVRLSGFPVGLRDLRGINYTGVSSWEDCAEDIFLKEESQRLISGYQLADRDVSDLDYLDVSLPVFENESGSYLCVRVELWGSAGEYIGFFGSQVESSKLFVTRRTIGSLLADAKVRYSKLEVKHTAYDFRDNHSVYSHIDSLFSLYAVSPMHVGEVAAIDMSFNLPGKLRIGGDPDVYGFIFEKVRYAYVESEEDCDEDTFKRLRPTLANRFDEGLNHYYTYDRPGYNLSFFLTDDDLDGAYLCIEATIKGDKFLADFHPRKVFSYEINFPDS